VSAASDLSGKVAEFCRASVGYDAVRAARMLAETPEIAGFDLATALLLGDAARVREELRRDPGLTTRADPRTGWTPLHAVCASRWHALEPSRADGLLEIARLLIDAGADPTRRTAGRRPGWLPLRCAIASAGSGAGNEPIVVLLLDHGAVPDDHDLYLAGFAAEAPRLLRLLVGRHPEAAAAAEQALAAPVSENDAESVGVLLEAGADPRRYRDDDGRPASALDEAVRAVCGAELVELLLAHGADPDAPGRDGRSPYRVALTYGRRDLAELLRRHGARDDATGAELFVAACLDPDRDEAERRLADEPGLFDDLGDDDRAAIVRAAGAGRTDAVALMLDLGFPLDARGENGATPLHAAAHTGSADTTRLLVERGADVEARDTSWDSTPLVWAVVGGGERPRTNPDADWVATVRALLDAGADPGSVELDDSTPHEIAELLRAHPGWSGVKLT
jgi:ankyrin repeat protein